MRATTDKPPSVQLFYYQRPTLEEIVERELAGWQGTPYLVGRQRRGLDGGVDCCRFVVGAADALSGRVTPLEEIPEDASLHDGAGTTAAMLRIAELCRAEALWIYSSSRAPDQLTVEAGDVLVSAVDRNGGAGHAKIVGAGCCWHATRAGVRKTGLGTARLLAAWRPRDKRDWILRAIPHG